MPKTKRSYWHDEANQLKAAGWPTAAIAAKFGKSIAAAKSATQNTRCPIDHRAVKAFELMQAKNADPEFRVANATRSRQRMLTQRKDRAFIEKLADGFETYRRYRAKVKEMRCAVLDGADSDKL